MRMVTLNESTSGWDWSRDNVKAAAPLPGLPDDGHAALTCAVGQGPAPAAVPLADSGAVAYEGLGPSARVVDRGPIRKQLSREDGVGGDPGVPAGDGLGRK